MKTTEIKVRKAAVLSILALALAAGLAGAAADRPASPQAAVALAYKFVEGAPLSYKVTETQIQNIDVMGQSMTTDANSILSVTLKPKGKKGADFVLGVTIDGMTSNIQSPQGGISPDLSVVAGKSFDLVLSPLGQEVDVSGATAITADFGQGTIRDLTSEFQAFFPDLPAAAVKIGDKWPSVDTIVQKSDSGEIRITLNNENTLDGFETVEGRECARIKTAIKGNMTGTGNQGGMSFEISAAMTGEGTWYFAVKDGIPVKSDTKLGLSGSIAAQGMDIGFTGEQKGAMALVKK